MSATAGDQIKGWVIKNFFFKSRFQEEEKTIKWRKKAIGRKEWMKRKTCLYIYEMFLCLINLIKAAGETLIYVCQDDYFQILFLLLIRFFFLWWKLHSKVASF